MRFIVTCLFVWSLTVSPATWNATGHKIIASIAFPQLTATEQVKIVALLKRHPRFVEDFADQMPEDVHGADETAQNEWLFKQAAVSPDTVRSGPSSAFTSVTYTSLAAKLPGYTHEAADMDEKRLKQLDKFLKDNDVILRADWGATDSKIKDVPDSYDWDYDTIVIHHSGRMGDTDPKVVQRKHVEKNKWDDVGYHFMIGPRGQTYEGRRLIYKGSHTENANTGKVGVLVMGNFEKELLGLLGSVPKQNQITTVKKLASALMQLFPTIKVLGGHKDFKKSTECPGNQLYPLLGDIRKTVALLAPPG